MLNDVMDMYDVRELVLVTSDEFVRLYGEVSTAIEQYAAASKVSLDIL